MFHIVSVSEMVSPSFKFSLPQPSRMWIFSFLVNFWKRMSEGGQGGRDRPMLKPPAVRGKKFPWHVDTETNIGQLFDILAAHRGQDDSRQIHFNQTERLDSVDIKQPHTKYLFLFSSDDGDIMSLGAPGSQAPDTGNMMSSNYPFTAAWARSESSNWN